MYSACGMPVYFVTDDWYDRVYVPHYREVVRYGPPRGEWHDRGYREHERREWHEDRGHGRGHDEGHGEGHGRGHGHGHDRD
jgi:hypothetical protein